MKKQYIAIQDNDSGQFISELKLKDGSLASEIGLSSEVKDASVMPLDFFETLQDTEQLRYQGLATYVGGKLVIIEYETEVTELDLLRVKSGTETATNNDMDDLGFEEFIKGMSRGLFE